jgi:hypothetical protein
VPTAVAVAVTVALVAPAGIATDAGTDTAPLELLSATLMPPAGAAAVSETVMVGLVTAPTTEVVLSAALATLFGVSVRVAVLLVPFAVAVIVAFTAAVTFPVVTVKVALVAPARTVTDAGTLAAPHELLSATERLPDGAAARVTVPVAFAAPPIALAGLRERPVTLFGLTVNVAAAELPA